MFGFNGINSNHNIHLIPNSFIDTTKVDSFQLAVDQYSALSVSKDSFNREIENLKDQIIQYKSAITKTAKELIYYQKVLSLEKIDSLKALFIKEIQYRTDDTAKKIKVIDEKAKTSDKLIKKQVEINKKYQSQLKNIQIASAKLIGSKCIRFKGVKYNMFIADLDSHDIRIHWKNHADKKIYYNIGSVVNTLTAQKLIPLMITNAGMYETNRDPQGLYIENKIEIFELDTTKPNSNNFYLKPNGVFYIDTNNIPHIDTTEAFARLYKGHKDKIKLATQSGPMLVINDKIHRTFINGSNNLNIRNGVGLISKKKVVFIISNSEVNFYDFSILFKDIFNCNDALFLDGAISKICT